jgi:DNA repair protein RadD
VHTKRGADDDAPKTMRVDYRVGLNLWIPEWVCVEHDGFARAKAEQWWQRRSPDPVPDTAARAVEIAEAGGLCTTKKIRVRSKRGERFDRIVGYVLGPLPEGVPITPTEYAEDEIPF